MVQGPRRIARGSAILFFWGECDMKCELTIITVILHHIKGLLEREMRLLSLQFNFRALQSGLCVCDQVMLVDAR